MTRALTPRPGARMTVPALALAVGLVAGGCSDGDTAPAPEAEPSATLQEPGDAPTLEVEPVTALGRVTGALPRPDRRAVADQVSAVAVRWLTAAYVDGRYPRGRFRDALTGFTPGARTVAQRDIAVLTNDPIGGRVEEVTLTRMGVTVDVLAVDQRAVGATAHVLTTVRTDGKVQRRVTVRGRLVLTRRDGSWKIFAYHVSKGDA